MTKADRGNLTVIMKTQIYINKTRLFFTDNNIKLLNYDPAEKYQNIGNESLNKCKHLILPNQSKLFKVIKLNAPKLRALLKVHKQDVKIRPLVNFFNVPTYKLSKFLFQVNKKEKKFENNFSSSNILI